MDTRYRLRFGHMVRKGHRRVTRPPPARSNLGLLFLDQTLRWRVPVALGGCLHHTLFVVVLQRRRGDVEEAAFVSVFPPSQTGRIPAFAAPSLPVSG